MKYLILLLLLLSACSSEHNDSLDTTKSFYSIDESCIGCKKCITDFSCPASAIKFDEASNKAFIDPASCIDCGQCYNFFSPKECPPNAFRAKGVQTGSKLPTEVITYKVDDDKCVSCGKCVSLFDCPTSAITLTGDDGKAVIDPEKCIGCGQCKTKEFCPTDAFDKSSLQEIGSIPIFNSDMATVDTNSEVSFVYSVESKGGEIKEIMFSAGDGTPSQTLTENEGFVTHSYSQHGCFAARITVTIDDASIYATREVTVKPLAPKFITSFDADIVIGKAPLTVTYSIGVESFGNDYTLSIKPDENGEEEELAKDDSVYVYIYDTPGTYAAKLFIKGKELSDDVEQTITKTLSQTIDVVSKDSDINSDSLALVNSANRLAFSNIAGFNSDPRMIYDHLVFPTTFEAYPVTWKSSSFVVSNNGTVERDFFDTDVAVTAIFTNNVGDTATKIFSLQVVSKDWNYHDVEKEKCIGCERCIQSQCPDAIVMVDGKAVINPVLCWGCQEQGCHALRVCPTDAITDIGEDKINEHLQGLDNE